MAVEPGRLVIIREGHGEAGAVENLVARAGKDLGVVPGVFWSLPPSPRVVITSPESAVRAAKIAATQSPAAALLTADLDDACPADVAPALARAVRDEGFSFPIAVVLFHREFETLAVAVGGQLAGRELRSQGGQPILTLKAPSDLPENPEAPRDAKGWVSRELMGGTSYKPTIHQLPLTRLLRIEDLRASQLSSFRRLESALKFLAGHAASGSTATYPQPSPGL